ncbi:hypothetical protein PUN28_017540 [Cardiocondyla obscurior]|uniref:Uncharacterized protein n=1 Tax=Cardiocondyla obscurior TaxID=286306 RepID=A0AAW2EK74_9HYME
MERKRAREKRKKKEVTKIRPRKIRAGTLNAEGRLDLMLQFDKLRRRLYDQCCMRKKKQRSCSWSDPAKSVPAARSLHAAIIYHKRNCRKRKLMRDIGAVNRGEFSKLCGV